LLERCEDHAIKELIAEQLAHVPTPPRGDI
jgi:hypothetical protein